MMLFNSYLKPIVMEKKGNQTLYELAIPNIEVSCFFEDSVRAWLEQRIGINPLNMLFKSLLFTLIVVDKNESG